MNYEQIWQQAYKYGESKYHTATNAKKHAFANSVAYLVTGASGGAGPFLREHAVTWSLLGDGERKGIWHFPDGRIPSAGEWEFEKACQFAESICFSEKLPAICKVISQNEYYFDDDHNDLMQLAQMA